MTIEQLRATWHAEPFRPFNIRMADGRFHHVPHPDFLFTSPTGRTLFVFRPDDSCSIIDLVLVNELEVPAAGSKATQGNGQAA